MQLPYTVINVWRGITVWELLTCETSHQSEILHSLIFWKVVGSCAHTRESRTATVHGAPYTVNSHVVVGAIYAYMCTYSYRTRCTIHGELKCGGGGNIRIHVCLQLPYTVHRTRCTVHGVLTCGGGGNIRIHVYLQLPYMVHRTRCTHVWWWGQYTHTCVPTATIHGELTCGGGGNIHIHVYLQLPYTVHRTRCTHVWW